MTRKEMETRRLSAFSDLTTDSPFHRKLSKKYGVSRTTIARWRHAIREGKSLKLNRAPGRPPRLTAEQIKHIYKQGPRALGFHRARWTTQLFAQAIEQNYDVVYDKDHVGRLLHKYTDWEPSGSGRRRMTAHA